MYCKHTDNEKEFETQKQQVLNYLNALLLKKPIQSINYVCDDDLIRKLIFDARLTNNIFHKNYRQFDTSLIFVATMSGLVRWKSMTNKFVKFF